MHKMYHVCYYSRNQIIHGDSPYESLMIYINHDWCLMIDWWLMIFNLMIDESKMINDWCIGWWLMIDALVDD